MGKQGRDGPGQDTPPGLAPCSLLLPPQVGLLTLRAFRGAGGSSTPGPRRGASWLGSPRASPVSGLPASGLRQTAERTLGTGEQVCVQPAAPVDETGHARACVVGLRPAATSFRLLPGSGPAGQAPRLAALPHSRATESPRGWGQSLTQRCVDPLPRSRARSSEGGGGQAPCEALEAGGQAGFGDVKARSSGGATRTGESGGSCGWTHLTGKRSGGLGVGVLLTPLSRLGTFLGWRRPCRGGEAQPPSPQRNGKTWAFTLRLRFPHAGHHGLPAPSLLLPVGPAHP